VETSQNRILNTVELSRRDIEQSKSGRPFSVRDILVDKPTTQEDGTRIILSHLNVRHTELPATIAYVERHLGRQLHNNTVVIAYSGAAEPQFRSKVSQCSGNCGATVPVMTWPKKSEIFSLS